MQDVTNQNLQLTSAEKQTILSFRMDIAGVCREFDDHFNALSERQQHDLVRKSNEEHIGLHQPMRCICDI